MPARCSVTFSNTQDTPCEACCVGPGRSRGPGARPISRSSAVTPKPPRRRTARPGYFADVGRRTPAAVGRIGPIPVTGHALATGGPCNSKRPLSRSRLSRTHSRTMARAGAAFAKYCRFCGSQTMTSPAPEAAGRASMPPVRRFLWLAWWRADPPDPGGRYRRPSRGVVQSKHAVVGRGPRT
jgi:hypothetical protein